MLPACGSGASAICCKDGECCKTTTSGVSNACPAGGSTGGTSGGGGGNDGDGTHGTSGDDQVLQKLSFSFYCGGDLPSSFTTVDSFALVLQRVEHCRYRHLKVYPRDLICVDVQGGEDRRRSLLTALFGGCSGGTADQCQCATAKCGGQVRSRLVSQC